MINIVDDEYMVCVDCLMVIANGDYSGLALNPDTEDRRTEAINRGLDRAGGSVCCGDQDKDEEFSNRGCDNCGCNLAGSLHHCVILGENDEV